LDKAQMALEALPLAVVVVVLAGHQALASRHLIMQMAAWVAHTVAVVAAEAHQLETAEHTLAE
jgi:uncharacterized integral membrane protein